MRRNLLAEVVEDARATAQRWARVGGQRAERPTTELPARTPAARRRYAPLAAALRAQRPVS